MGTLGQGNDGVHFLFRDGINFRNGGEFDVIGFLYSVVIEGRRLAESNRQSARLKDLKRIGENVPFREIQIDIAFFRRIVGTDVTVDDVSDVVLEESDFDFVLTYG